MISAGVQAGDGEVYLGSTSRVIECKQPSHDSLFRYPCFQAKFNCSSAMPCGSKLTPGAIQYWLMPNLLGQLTFGAFTNTSMLRFCTNGDCSQPVAEAHVILFYQCCTHRLAFCTATSQNESCLLGMGPDWSRRQLQNPAWQAVLPSALMLPVTSRLKFSEQTC